MSDTTSIYIHVPFCIKKCRYCDFYSQENLLLIPDYVRTLQKEIEYRSDPKVTVETIYFGGGTPSVLSQKEIEKILQSLIHSFQVMPEVEITVEVNPGTVDASYLSDLKRLGVNRLSIGVQSFSEKKLHFLDRIHSVDQGKRVLVEADNVGFDNIGFDLMYGLPFESESLWHKDLETAIEFKPGHLSCYMLTIENGTPLHADVKKGLVSPVSGDRQSHFFRITSRVLTGHGFDHYEISNFSKGSGKRSKHNSNYWNMTPYLGFGPAAHSYDGKTRSWNHSDINQYINDVQCGRQPGCDKEKLTLDQTMLEMIMLGLRTTQGVDLNAFNICFDILFEKKFKRTLDQIEQEKFGLIKNNHFFLNLEGRIHLNGIIEAFARQII